MTPALELKKEKLGKKGAIVQLCYIPVGGDSQDYRRSKGAIGNDSRPQCKKLKDSGQNETF